MSFYFLRQANGGNIGGDYEIGRSVCPCVRVCVFMSLRRHISITVLDRGMVAMDHI